MEVNATKSLSTVQARAALVDSLAMQAEQLAQSAAMNLLQLGRVLSQAKALVDHGQWEAWVKAHAKMSKRTAEQYMQAYAEFGLNGQIAELGTAKVIKLLPMSDDEREKLLSENDVAAMSTRELDKAIKAQREQIENEVWQKTKDAIAKLEEEKNEAERLLKEADKRAPEIPVELTDELRKSRDEIERLKSEMPAMLDEANALRAENAKLRRDAQETEALLKEQQDEIERAQSELLEAKSSQARGGAERSSAYELTRDVFGAAVREFMGTCARMPQMRRSFAAMQHEEKQGWDELLCTVESWCRSSRDALDSYAEGGVYVD